jgi:hypothetical protein
MPTTFLRCHLQVLRSLYYASGSEGQGIAGRRPLLCHRRSSARNGMDCCLGIEDEDEEDRTEDNAMAKDDDITGGGVTDRNDTAKSYHVYESETHVDDEIWSLIERFLQLRAQYRPHKERQLHWSKSYAESNTRLESIMSMMSSSINSKQDGHQHVPSSSKSSLSTPRTTLLATYGRSGSVNALTPSFSLTPVSSNRSKGTKARANNREDQCGGDLVATLPAWNFIHQMLHRRSQLSMKSCESFRSQPFLSILQREAEMRCNLIQKILEEYRNSVQHHHLDHVENKQGLAMQIRARKRRKLEHSMDFQSTTGPTTVAARPSSLGKFILSKYSNHVLDSHCDAYTNADEVEDFFACAQMKLHLWASLLSSVWEVVVDESSSRV